MSLWDSVTDFVSDYASPVTDLYNLYDSVTGSGSAQANIQASDPWLPSNDPNAGVNISSANSQDDFNQSYNLESVMTSLGGIFGGGGNTEQSYASTQDYGRFDGWYE